MRCRCSSSAFEGPLDLLLYLIRNQNLDILEHSDRRDHAGST